MNNISNLIRNPLVNTKLIVKWIELNTEMIGNGFTESLPDWLKNTPTTNTKWYLYAKLAVKFGVWEVWDDSPKPPVNSIFMTTNGKALLLQRIHLSENGIWDYGGEVFTFYLDKPIENKYWALICPPEWFDKNEL